MLNCKASDRTHKSSKEKEASESICDKSLIKNINLLLEFKRILLDNSKYVSISLLNPFSSASRYSRVNAETRQTELLVPSMAIKPLDMRFRYNHAEACSIYTYIVY